jgi:hypothetical protein
MERLRKDAKANRPEALRLAAQLEDAESAKLHLLPYAAAELRRLVAENELLASALGKLRSMFRDGRMELLRQRDQATAQRDELLEALISFTNSAYIKKHHPKRYAAAIAAIKKAEGTA